MFAWSDMMLSRVDAWMDDSQSKMIFVLILAVLIGTVIIVGGVLLLGHIFPPEWHTYTYCEPTVVSTGKTFVNGWRCR